MCRALERIEAMKYLKGSVFAVVILISGMYGWSLMSTAINQQADQAATVLVEDIMSSNIAWDIQNLRELKRLMAADKADEASDLADEVIDSKLYMLAQCVSDKCAEIRSTLDVGKSL
jgi:hypothetical protein